jgi:hypothetical protein
MGCEKLTSIISELETKGYSIAISCAPTGSMFSEVSDEQNNSTSWSGYFDSHCSPRNHASGRTYGQKQ